MRVSWFPRYPIGALLTAGRPDVAWLHDLVASGRLFVHLVHVTLQPLLSFESSHIARCILVLSDSILRYVGLRHSAIVPLSLLRLSNWSAFALVICVQTLLRDRTDRCGLVLSYFLVFDVMSKIVHLS